MASGDNRLSFTERHDAILAGWWLQICVCDHHSLISSTFASRSVQLLETELSLLLVLDYGTVSQEILSIFCFSFSLWSLSCLLRRPR